MKRRGDTSLQWVAALATSALLAACGELKTPDTPERAAASTAAAASNIASSPFAPFANAGERSEALASLIQTARLVGVRTALEPARSGAVIILPSGEQRAFRVGEEIAPGVRLAEVGADHVVLQDNAAQERLALQEGAAGAPALLAAGPPAQVRASGGGLVLAGISMLAEGSDGAIAGWRVQGAVPANAARAGLRSGDLIVEVNGAPPTAAALPPDLSAQSIQLTIVRGAGERVTIALEPASRT